MKMPREDVEKGVEKLVDTIQNEMYQNFIQKLLTRRCCYFWMFLALILILVAIFNYFSGG